MLIHSISILVRIVSKLAEGARPARRRHSTAAAARHPKRAARNSPRDHPPRAARHPPPPERKRLAAQRAVRHPVERFGLLGSGRMGFWTKIGLKF